MVVEPGLQEIALSYPVRVRLGPVDHLHGLGRAPGVRVRGSGYWLLACEEHDRGRDGLALLAEGEEDRCGAAVVGAFCRLIYQRPVLLSPPVAVVVCERSVHVEAPG